MSVSREERQGRQTAARKPKRFRYSEIFRSLQGEGSHTGKPSVFLRFWGCNFQCRGFSNPQGLEPVEFKPALYQNITDLPVIERGCDTVYSWRKDFQHLSTQATAVEICGRIESLCQSFLHPISNQWTHLVVTGGEPMLSQNAIVEVLEAFEERNNLPSFVTIETNGTRRLTDGLRSTVQRLYGAPGREWLWSVSPKLSHSGELWEKAIKPDVVAGYAAVSDVGQLKYVADGSDDCWAEISKATAMYRDAKVDFPVWIMPVGSTVEQVNETQRGIAEQTIELGYNFSARVHSHIFGNEAGT